MSAGIAERYDTAVDTSDLTLRLGRCDADMLLAAGYATAGDTRGAQALALYRMRATGSRVDVARAVDGLTAWLLDRRRQPRAMRIASARAVAATVLHWWLDDVCRACGGRGYELVPGTQIVGDTPCQACGGAGRSALEHRVPSEHRDAARWLAGEIDESTQRVFSAMARRLRRDVDMSCLCAPTITPRK